MIVFLIRPRLGAVFVSALVGAAGAVAGVILMVGRLRPALWASAWTHWHVPAALAGLLALGGIALQYRAAFAADRARKRQEAEPPDKDKTKTAGSAEKK